MAIVLIVAEPGPLLVSVIVCAPLVVFTVWFAKPTETGERVSVGGTGVPVPLRLTDCGLPVALSVIVIEAERALAAEGVKVALIEQEPFAARVAGQLLV